MTTNNTNLAERFTVYSAARERFLEGHRTVRDCLLVLKANLKTLEASLLEVDKAGPALTLTLAKQKLEQAIHADASGVLGTPLPADIDKVVAEATKAVEVAE